MRVARARSYVTFAHVPDPVLGELTWAERVIIRRVRLGWDKKELAERAGVTRMTLWRTVECKDVKRRMTVTDSLRESVEAALLEGERQQEADDAALAEAVA